MVLQEAIAGEPSPRIPCPYPGMVPFQPEDASRFHGREGEIAQMVGLLRHQRFMMVIGPSGSGKSSLVQAGLLPELARSRYFEEGFWLVRRMRPGPAPSDALARVFDSEATADGPDLESVDRLLAAHPPARRVLLLVDQFEETFTQAMHEEAGRFISALQGLRTRENLALVLTLRADFYPDLMTSYLWPVDASQRVEVAPLRGDALRESIVRPAADAGVQIEPSLVERLLADAANEPGVLPLLQETMRLLWDDIEGRVLPLAAYERLNRDPAAGTGRAGATGLAAAIAMKADATLAELTLEQQAIARRTFLRLVQFGEGRADTRRQQPLWALRAADDDPALFERTLEHLTDHRLLTFAGAGERESAVVDIAHESLITGWAQLREWTEERRETEQVRRRLEDKAAEWERLGRDTGGLLDKAELPEAERWLASADAKDLGYSEALPALVRNSQRALQQAEREREDARQRELAQAQALAEEQRRHAEGQARAAAGLRRLATLLAGVFVVAVVAAAFAWWQGEKAQTLAEKEAVARQEAEARRGESERARAEAERLRAASVAQLLLTLAPEQQAINQHERSALMARQAYLLGGSAPGRLRDHADRVLRAVLASPDFAPSLAPRVSAVAFSPDGRMLAASSLAGKKESQLLLWDLDRRGAPPTALPGPADDFIYALSFRPDGKALAAADEAGVVFLWDLQRPGDPPVVLAEHEAGAWSLAFSPDGRRLAIGAKRDDTVLLLDLSDPDAGLVFGAAETPVRDPVSEGGFYPGGVPVAFSPDGRTLASGSRRGSVRLWDPSAPTKPVREYRGHEGPVWSLAFGPHGNRLASGGRDAIVKVWDMRDADIPPRVLGGHEKEVVSLAFSPDGETLASGSIDNTVQLWDLSSPGARAVVLRSDLEDVYDVAFSPDGFRLASAAPSGGLRLWDLRPSGQPSALPGHDGATTAVTFSPDGEFLGVTVDQSVRLWKLSDLTAAPTVLQGHTGNVWSATFSPDGKMLSSTSKDDIVKLWRLGSPIEEIAEFPATDPWAAPFSPDGKTLATASWNEDIEMFVRLWDLGELGAEPAILRTEMTRWINEIAFSPDGRRLVATGREGIIHLEDLEHPGAGAEVLRGHEGMIWSVVFSPDGTRLASGGGDRTVRLWDLAVPGAPSSVLGRHDDAVLRVRFSPDGKYLASSSKDTSIRLWDLSSPGTPPALLSGHESAVWALAFSPDSKILASGAEAKGVLLWDLTHPVNTAQLEQLADLVCEKVWRNLTIEEWREFVSEDMPYERTCPDLPAHPSVAGDG
jgi:WD40 repeat protein